MRLKKYLSLFLVLALALSAAAGGYAVSADAVGETITYSYMIKTASNPAAFEGTLTYPAAALRVNNVQSDVAVLGGGLANDLNGEILFNNTNAQYAFDLSGYTALITVEFEVIGSYDSGDISVSLDELYSTATIQSGNIPYFYKNIVDGERVSSGYTDIDNASNNVKDPDNISYTVVYTYADSSSTFASRTKTVRSPSENALTIAALGEPRIENPYYNYSLEDASFAADGSIAATLSASEKEYQITCNGTVTKLGYLESFTAEAGEESDFLIDGKVVATGTEYSFYVTSDATITTGKPTGVISDSASIVRNALAITDNPEVEGDALVKMEFLATVRSSDFARMGAALALSEKSADEIAAAVTAVSEGSAVSDKILVYNSAVDWPNKSGQYQFIYAPYFSVSQSGAGRVMYFYTFGVDSQGKVTVSDVHTVNMNNVLA